MRRAFDWLFRNRDTGRITIGQAPNPPLYVFAAASLASWLCPAGSTAATVAGVVASLALAWWAADELLRGVNPWRRILGAAVLAYLAWRLVG